MGEPALDAPIFFAAPAQWRAWLAEHHATAGEVLVGFHRRATGRPSLTWPESVDEALCFGWIDGVRRRLDETSYTIRFTPRRPGSIWSAVNVRRFGELQAEGRVAPAGAAAFARRREDRTAIYSYERDEPVALPEEFERALRADRAAAAFFDAQPAGYRNTAIHWVMRAKREETRRRRLDQLVADSAAGLRVKPLRWP